MHERERCTASLGIEGTGNIDLIVASNQINDIPTGYESCYE